MACFIVPATEAIVSTVATKIIEKKEMNNQNTEVSEVKIEKFSTKLKRLNKLLWGGSALLAFEHVWHGEVAPFFPFLTAAGNPEDLAEMLTEMSTVGVGMAIAVTAAWAGSCLVLSAIDKKNVKENA